MPTSEELHRKAVSGEVLTRPELCLLLSYSKRSAYHELRNSTFSHDKYFESYIINYFPKIMQEKFRAEILSHPVKHEIIKTVVINKIINQLGGPLISIIKRETGAPLCDIIRTYTIICGIFNLDDIWETVSNLATNIDYNIKIDMFTEVTKLMRRGLSWFITNLKHPINISKTIEEFRMPAEDLRKIVGTLLVGEAKIKFEEKLNYYVSSGIEKSFAKDVLTFDSFISVFDIIHVTKQTSGNNEEIAKTYFAIGKMFNFDWLRKTCDKQLNDSYWRRLGLHSLKDDLYDKQRRLLVKIITISKTTFDFDSWIDNNKTLVKNFLDFIKEIKSQETIDLNVIILANKKFEIFLQKLEQIMSSTLKQTRVDLGKTVNQVSTDLKIRKKYLIALEEGNLDVLPGEVYVKGYLKLYLDYLNIKERNAEQLEANKKNENGKLINSNRNKILINYKHKKQLVLISIIMLSIIIIIYPLIESA